MSLNLVPDILEMVKCPRVFFLLIFLDFCSASLQRIHVE